MAVLITMTLATSMAARLGPIPMAGYQICTQVWLAVSLLTDALAIAGQVPIWQCLSLNLLWGLYRYHILAYNLLLCSVT